jgi:hypothetical protein
VITFLLYLLLKKAILLLLVLGGMGFAIVRWKRHPRVSLLTVLALGFYLLQSLTFALLYRWLPTFFYSLKLTAQNISTLDSVLQLIEDFAFVAVLILLVAAAFTGRNRERATN